MKESLLVAQVLAWLNAQPNTYAWRNNTGATRIRGRFVTFGDRGSPDILAIAGGGFLGVECKSGVGKQRPEQARWQAKCEKAGGVYVVARCLDEVKAAHAQAKKPITTVVHFIGPE